jgi:hypothetical protein
MINRRLAAVRKLIVSILLLGTAEVENCFIDEFYQVH